jgi:hypothetical protein
MKLGTTPSPITGVTAICAGDSATLSDITPGGAWSSSNTSVATAGTGTGTITGVAAGTTIISYMVSGSVATIMVTVNAAPNAGVIRGISAVFCMPFTTLTDTTAGGTWISSNIGIATVNSTGLVTGDSLISAWDTIFYIVTNSCGSDTAKFPILFYCEGIETIANPITALNIFPNPTQSSFTLTLSSPTNETAKITITNMLGEKVKEMTIATNKETDLQLRVPPGVYFISGVMNGGILSGKIVVE